MANSGKATDVFALIWPGKRRAGCWKGHLQPDHVHMLISIPPKYAVAQVVG